MLRALSLRPRRSPAVPIGAVFRRIGPGQAREMAQVLSVAEDNAGIPHVRYRLRVERPDRDPVAPEDRTLSLGAFVERYPERVGVTSAA